MQTIAVLITCFNRKAKTLKCLESLYAQLPVAGYETDVYLTDDGCTDGTPEAVRSRFPKVHIIEGDGNLYWNRGMHAAWTQAAKTKNYDFYLWLNDDTMVYPGMLRTLLDTSRVLDDRCIVAGSTCCPHDPSRITYGGRTGKGTLLHPADHPLECDYFNGNIVLFPRYVYRNAGMNDPVFRHALGDFDYGLRAKKSGIRSIVAPGVLGECEAHDSLPAWCDPRQPFGKRWKSFRSPLGHDPEEFFIYACRHQGFALACFHYFTNHLRVVFPKLWK